MKNVQRLIALGLNAPLAEKLEALVTKWAEASGPEWTVKRLKSLKIEMINMWAGCSYVTPWVRRNRDGFPSGVIAELFRLSLRGKRGRFTAINSLMIYTSFLSDKVTETQRTKFFSSMESIDSTGLSVVPEYTRSIGVIHYIKCGNPWVNSPLSGDRYQPGPDGKSYPETDTFISFVSALTARPIFHLVQKYSPLFSEVIPVRLMQNMWTEGLAEMKYSVDPINQCVGKISYIQEPGFKLRAVANPNRILQAVLEPLKEALGKVLESLPNDFTFDQAAGVEVVKGWLHEGKTVYSVDLSDATNLFPLNYTEACLLTRIRIPDPENRKRFESLVGIFSAVSRSPWFSKENGELTVHTFTRGQPLGLGPSFFAFGLAHNILLQDICWRLGLRKADGLQFAILGDDVVIADRRVYDEYRRHLDLLGCQVSKEKSLVSDKVAEFAGKIILEQEMIPQFKWRELGDTNFIDFVRNVGPKGVVLLSPRQKQVVDLIAEVPEFIGGLGWNPMGLSLEIRMNPEFFPIVGILLEKDLTVYLPHRRVDVGIVDFVHDNRLLELTPNNQKVINSVSAVLPTREVSEPLWGNDSFWNRFSRAQKQAQLLPELIEAPDPTDVGDATNPFLVRQQRLYVPYSKGSTDPTARKELKWFDLVRVLTRLRSRS
jgi:hypothetical protein